MLRWPSKGSNDLASGLRRRTPSRNALAGPSAITVSKAIGAWVPVSHPRIPTAPKRLPKLTQSRSMTAPDCADCDQSATTEQWRLCRVRRFCICIGFV